MTLEHMGNDDSLAIQNETLYRIIIMIFKGILFERQKHMDQIVTHIATNTTLQNRKYQIPTQMER